jgi:hypothetical protein
MIALLAASLIALHPLTGPSPAPTPDPSDSPCFRGSLTCFPRYYGGGSEPCQYILGRWVTPFGRDCASGSGWRGGAK